MSSFFDPEGLFLSKTHQRQQQQKNTRFLCESPASQLNQMARREGNGKKVCVEGRADTAAIYFTVQVSHSE